MRISDWTSDVCSSDLQRTERGRIEQIFELDARPEWQNDQALRDKSDGGRGVNDRTADAQRYEVAMGDGILCFDNQIAFYASVLEDAIDPASCPIAVHERYEGRSEEHTSELQSLMRISYAVFCLNKNNITNTKNDN